MVPWRVWPPLGRSTDTEPIGNSFVSHILAPSFPRMCACTACVFFLNRSNVLFRIRLCCVGHHTWNDIWRLVCDAVRKFDSWAPNAPNFVSWVVFWANHLGPLTICISCVPKIRFLWGLHVYSHHFIWSRVTGMICNPYILALISFALGFPFKAQHADIRLVRLPGWLGWSS